MTSSYTSDVLYVVSLHGDPHVSVVLVYEGREVEFSRACSGDGTFVPVGGAPGLAERTLSTVVVPAIDILRVSCKLHHMEILTLNAERRSPLHTGRCLLYCV